MNNPIEDVKGHGDKEDIDMDIEKCETQNGEQDQNKEIAGKPHKIPGYTFIGKFPDPIFYHISFKKYHIAEIGIKNDHQKHKKQID